MAYAAKGFGYDRVAAGITRMISADGYEVGQKLPKLEDLQDRFGASSTTTRKAVDILKEQGIVESRQGSGLFVQRLPSEDEVGPAVSDQEEVRDAVNDLRQQMRTLNERIAQIESTLQLQEQSPAKPSRTAPQRAPKAQP